jgi:hypothetical protein
MKSSDLVTIHAFRATDSPELCADYIAEHRKVLEDFGVLQIVGGDHSWMSDPDCIVLMATHRDLGHVGGIRIERATRSKPLPMERTIAPMDPTIHDAIAGYMESGYGEICGLWNANRFAGKGIPLLLSMAAVAVSQQVGVHALSCFVAHYTLRHALKVGFQILEDVGEGGSFNFPMPRIKSFAMVIPDTILLESAPNSFRQRILSLRCRPAQERIESLYGVVYPVRYVLHVDASRKDLSVYGNIASEYLRQCA